MRDRGRDALQFAALYVAIAVPLHLAWELAQLPLYTVWAASTRAAVWAAVHCTGGDALVAIGTLALAAVTCGRGDWPRRRTVAVAVTTVALGLAYTIASEWLNVELRGTWAYTGAMPRVPPLGTGLSPLLQWLNVPPLAFAGVALARRRGAGGRDGVQHH